MDSNMLLDQSTPAATRERPPQHKTELSDCRYGWPAAVSESDSDEGGGRSSDGEDDDDYVRVNDESEEGYVDVAALQSSGMYHQELLNHSMAGLNVDDEYYGDQNPMTNVGRVRTPSSANMQAKSASGSMILPDETTYDYEMSKSQMLKYVGSGPGQHSVPTSLVHQPLQLAPVHSGPVDPNLLMLSGEKTYEYSFPYAVYISPEDMVGI